MTISQPFIDPFLPPSKKQPKLGQDDDFEVLNVSLAKQVQQYIEFRLGKTGSLRPWSRVMVCCTKCSAENILII